MRPRPKTSEQRDRELGCRDWRSSSPLVSNGPASNGRRNVVVLGDDLDARPAAASRGTKAAHSCANEPTEPTGTSLTRERNILTQAQRRRAGGPQRLNILTGRHAPGTVSPRRGPRSPRDPTRWAVTSLRVGVGLALVGPDGLEDLREVGSPSGELLLLDTGHQVPISAGQGDSPLLAIAGTEA